MGAGVRSWFRRSIETCSGIRAVPILPPDEAGGVAVEAAALDHEQFAGAAPVALVVGDHEIAVAVEIDAVR